VIRSPYAQPHSPAAPRHPLDHLAEAERQCAAGVPYPDKAVAPRAAPQLADCVQPLTTGQRRLRWSFRSYEPSFTCLALEQWPRAKAVTTEALDGMARHMTCIDRIRKQFKVRGQWVA
jgi:hypothetical protein